MSKVIVVDYDSSWPQTFERLRANLWPRLCDVTTSIEHVGSTSVPGLAAKPIIDMDIVVPTASAMRAVIDRLAAIGYLHRGDLGVPGREAFARPPDMPAHHLYACVAESDSLRNHLALRDFLRSNPASVQAYSALKKEMATRFPDDIDAYIDGKTDFVLSILAGAEFSVEQIARIRAINSNPKATG